MQNSSSIAWDICTSLLMPELKEAWRDTSKIPHQRYKSFLPFQTAFEVGSLAKYSVVLQSVVPLLRMRMLDIVYTYQAFIAFGCFLVLPLASFTDML